MNNKVTNKILILFAHPALQKSRINIELVKAIKNITGITFRDLYEIYPDFLIDVKEEQQLLLEHDVIVLQHPFYWYSCPAIIKEWVDLVLEYGFAYGHEGTALKGKMIMTAITTGGSEDSYKPDGVHKYHVRDYLKTFEQTADFCEMKYLPPFVVHNTFELKNSQDISVYKELYEKVITSLRDGDIDINSVSKFKYINDYFLDQYKSWSA
ncbi:MAG: NAD(P)H-dependent oxidoreductase [Candidatus Dadabacteria bacterium]|nr:NAD(P)H-dependent oxidoreductase [Candidatus Dadabacteria bacterium]MCZ6555529.1 NAD(P)H-dependent oxidoreductase [Candidatus Dadabacteria bacterium]MCZ6639666.1 NAD(P)H-dependent oxidoreductase [Candidatus Dadabacteria bacterium]